MNTRHLLIFTLTALLLPHPALAQAARTSTGNPDNGSELYFNHGCYQCHGYSGYGRATLHTPDSPNLANEADFITYLRQRAEIAPVRNFAGMPNYAENTLSDAQARDIYAYILAMPESDPAIEDVPLFESILEAADRPYRP